MKKLEPTYIIIANKDSEAAWAYGSNITDENEIRMNEISAKTAKFTKAVANKVNKYDWKNFKDEDLKRQMSKLAKRGYAALPEDKYKELLSVLSKMESNFAKVKVCDYKNKTKCDLSLEPDLETIFTTSRDPNELEYYWIQFYNSFKSIRKTFERYVELTTESSILNSQY